MWIVSHTRVDDVRSETLINTDHIARVRRSKEGKAVILWAITNRASLTLDEPYVDFMKRIR